MRKRTLLDLQTLLNGQLKFFWKKITENVLFIFLHSFLKVALILIQNINNIGPLQIILIGLDYQGQK